MARTFLELLSQLRDAKTKKKIERITDELSLILEEDDKQARFFLYPMFKWVKDNTPSKNFSKIVESEFYHTEVRAYEDDDSKTKVVVNMAFLQDNDEHEENIEEKVLNNIVKYIKENNLNYLVNDISVNDLQFRNGKNKKISYHS